MITKWIDRRMASESPKVRRKKIGIFSGVLNMILNLLLSAAKMLLGALTGSVAVTADAINNLSDCSASAVTLIGFALAAKKPDRKHPFGYGRIEYLAGAVVSLLILLFSIELARSSVERILRPFPLRFSWVLLAALLLTALVKLYMWRLNTQIEKAIGGSNTVKAAALDCISDVAVTLLSALSLFLSQYLSFPIDGYLGILIAAIIFFGGFAILLDTIHPLLGQPADREMAEEIQKRTLQYPDIIGVHDMIIHNYGPSRTIVTLHAEVPANRDILFAHEVIDRAEREISEQMDVTMLIHLDPVVTDNQRVEEARKQLAACLHSICPRYSMHDFRMIEGKEQIRLIFDVTIPYDDKTEESEIVAVIRQKMREISPLYSCTITIDRSFIEEK